MPDRDNERDHRADALEALAAGQTDPAGAARRSDGPSGRTEDSPVSPDIGRQEEDPAALRAEAGEPDIPTAAPISQKARASAHHRRAGRAHAEQFKKFMVPLLLVSGVLLFVLGGAASFVVFGDEAPRAEDALLSLGARKLLVLAAFPLGAILLLGAWLFHLEVRRSNGG